MVFIIVASMGGERTALGLLGKDRRYIAAYETLIGHFPGVFGERAPDNTLSKVLSHARELEVKETSVPFNSILKVTATDTFVQFAPWRHANLELESQEDNTRQLRFGLRFVDVDGHEGSIFFSWRGQKGGLLTRLEGVMAKPEGGGLRLIYHDGMVSMAHSDESYSIPTFFSSFFVNNSPFVPSAEELREAQSGQAVFLSKAALKGRNMLVLEIEGLDPGGEEVDLVLPLTIQPQPRGF